MSFYLGLLDDESARRGTMTMARRRLWRDWAEEMRSIRVPDLPDLTEGGVARSVPLGAVSKL